MRKAAIALVAFVAVAITAFGATIAAIPMPQPAALGDIDGRASSSRGEGLVQLAKDEEAHTCGAYGRANKCVAKWDRRTAQCRCTGR